MGACTFCGQPAGFLRSVHRECAEKHARGIQEIEQLVGDAPFLPSPTTTLATQTKEIGDRSFIGDQELRKLWIEGWASSLHRAMNDGVIGEEREARLTAAKDQLGLTPAELDVGGAWSSLVKSAAIRDLLDNKIPTRCKVDGSLNINFLKSEQFVWAFQGTQLLEDRVHRQYVGGSSGVSVRVMRGVYYHTNGFRGHPIERTERDHVDVGLFVVTNRNLYFAGATRSFRLPYAKIVSFQSYSDGLGLVRDASNAKPQIFVTGDGWFTYNLVTNCARLAAE